MYQLLSILSTTENAGLKPVMQAAISFIDHFAFAIYLILWLILLLAASKFVERVWVGAIGYRAFRIFVAPGIIIHEYSHALACLVTGAKIHEIKLFNKEGGFVKHEQPRWPPKFTFFSKVLISFAPILGCILVIWFVIFAFENITEIDLSEEQASEEVEKPKTENIEKSKTENVEKANSDIKPEKKTTENKKEIKTAEINPVLKPEKVEQPETFGGVFTRLFKSIWQKIVNITMPLVEVNWLFGLIFLWLLLSLSVGIAPSAQDFKNSIIGLIILIILIFVVSWGITAASDRTTVISIFSSMEKMVSFTLAIMAFAVAISSVIAAPLKYLLHSNR